MNLHWTRSLRTSTSMQIGVGLGIVATSAFIGIRFGDDNEIVKTAAVTGNFLGFMDIVLAAASATRTKRLKGCRR